MIGPFDLTAWQTIEYLGKLVKEKTDGMLDTPGGDERSKKMTVRDM